MRATRESIAIPTPAFDSVMATNLRTVMHPKGVHMIDGAFVGLDVNKTGIQVAIRPTGEHWTTGIDDTGISLATEKLTEMHPQLVVMQAQGGLELPVAGTLATAGVPFALISPRSVRDFARAIGRMRADRDQAGLLAYFAELVRPEVRKLPPKIIEQLNALKTRRQEVLKMLALERSRLNTDSLPVQKDIKAHVF